MTDSVSLTEAMRTVIKELDLIDTGLFINSIQVYFNSYVDLNKYVLEIDTTYYGPFLFAKYPLLVMFQKSEAYNEGMRQLFLDASKKQFQKMLLGKQEGFIRPEVSIKINAYIQ